MAVNHMIERFGKTFDIVRSGEHCATAKAIYNADNSTLSFSPNTDVKVGDVLNGQFGESYFITKVTPLTERGKLHHIEAKCKDQNEIELAQTSSVFNIGTVNNSVIGNGNYVSVTIESLMSQVAEKGGEDTQELTEIVDLLNKILNNQVPVKQGMLSKFSDVLEKHSWLSGAFASAFFNFLTLKFQ